MNMNVEHVGMANDRRSIIQAHHISHVYTADKGNDLTVLDDISMTLYEGEVVAILGRSGAGKSTLLRSLAGLVQPTSGSISYRGKQISGPNPGVALVFQSFALLPWLTVQQNVELGLEAKGVERSQRTALALAAIDSIGLDGFESAYPKELSGGMRQRVGIARALVLSPDALFMDEPFSALDVLTAENLRQEVLNLWSSDHHEIKSVLIVTHNIEEAVQMADRVIVLGSHPGRIIANVRIGIDRPRDKHTPEFEAMVDKLYTILTSGVPVDVDDTHEASLQENNSRSQHDSHHDTDKRADLSGKKSSAQREILSLPNATPGGLAGLVDIVAEYPDGIDVADLAADLSFEVDDLFPLIDAGTMLGAISAQDGQVRITDDGTQWHNADILEAKQIFAKLALEHAPLVRTIEQALRKAHGKRLRGELIFNLLNRRYTDIQARQQLQIAIEWGRYGELFDYDANDDLLTLDEMNA